MRVQQFQVPEKGSATERVGYSPSSTSIEIADHEAAFWLAKDGALDFDFEVGVRLVFCLVLIYQKLLKLEFHLDPW